MKLSDYYTSAFVWRAVDFKERDEVNYTYYIGGCDPLYCAHKQLGNTKVHILLTRIHAHMYRDSHHSYRLSNREDYAQNKQDIAAVMK